MTCVICNKDLDEKMIKNRKKTCAVGDCQVSHESGTSKLRKRKARDEKKQLKELQSNVPGFDDLSKSAITSLICALQDARASKDTSLFTKARSLFTNANFDNLLITIRHQVNLQVAIKVVDISHFETMKDMALFAADNLLLTALDLNEFYLGIAPCLRGGIVYGFFIFPTLRLAMMQLKEVRVPEEPIPHASGIHAIQWFAK